MRATKKIEIRMDEIRMGVVHGILEDGFNLFSRIENTLVKWGVAHNLTSIDKKVDCFRCYSVTITYNTPN